MVKLQQLRDGRVRVVTQALRVTDGNEKEIRRGERFYRKCKDTKNWPPTFVHAWINTDNINKLITVIVGSATLAMVGTIVAEFIAADAGIGYSIRIALFQSDLAKILVALFLIGVCTSLYLVLLEWIGHLIQKRWEIPEGG